MQLPSARRSLWTLFFLALAVRLAAIWRFGPSRLQFGDAYDYLSAATSLCAGSYPDHSSMPFFRAPGLPFFIAASTLCHPGAIWLVKTALAVAGACAILVVYALSRDLFGNRRISLLATAFTAFYPFFAVQSMDVQSEGLFMLLLLLAVWLSLRRAPTQPALFFAGVSASLAALDRPVGLVLFFLLPLWLVFFRKSGRALLPFLAGAALCLGPWAVRNEIRFHELILVNDAGGYNFWRGTSAELAAINALSDPEEFNAASVHFETVTTPFMASQVNRVASTPSTRSGVWFRLAFEDFSREPVAFAGRLFRNAWMFWRPWLNPATSSTAVVVLSGLLVSALYLTGIHGWTLLKRSSPDIAQWFAIAALTFWILQIPFQVVSRFRIPITDPFLLIFAAASIEPGTFAGRLSTLIPPAVSQGPRG